MARPTSSTLTDAELRLMKVLWDRGPLTVSALTAGLAESGVEVSESTVRTILGILREKRYAAVSTQGRAHVYRPLVSRSQARRQALRHVLNRFFDGSREELVLSLLRDEDVTRTELSRLRRIIQEDG